MSLIAKNSACGPFGGLLLCIHQDLVLHMDDNSGGDIACLNRASRSGDAETVPVVGSRCWLLYGDGEIMRRYRTSGRVIASCASPFGGELPAFACACSEGEACTVIAPSALVNGCLFTYDRNPSLRFLILG